MWVVYIIPAICSANHSSSHMSPVIVSVCDRQKKGRGSGAVGCLRVIRRVWAGPVESVPCALHTVDCISDKPHPSRAYRAGTLPSRAADVRGDLQRHAASWRGAQGRGGDGVVVMIVGVLLARGVGLLKWRGKLMEDGFVTFWSSFLKSADSGVYRCHEEMLICQVWACIRNSLLYTLRVFRLTCIKHPACLFHWCSSG